MTDDPALDSLSGIARLDQPSPIRDHGRAPATPLLNRNPLLFWKCVSLILVGIIIACWRAGTG